MSRPVAWYSTAPTLPEEWLRSLASTEVDWRPLPLVDTATPPPDPRPIERAASELPLYDAWIAADAWAAAALLERAGGALPSRLATISVGLAACWLLAEHGIESTIAADSIDAVVAALAHRDGRQERLLLPGGEAATTDLGRRIGPGFEVVSPPAYGSGLPPGTLDRLRDFEADRPATVLFTDIASVAAFRRHAGPGAIRALALDAHVAEALAQIGVTAAEVGADPMRIAEGAAGPGASARRSGGATGRHPAAILFDLDGVLIDSREVWFRLLNAACERFGAAPLNADGFEAMWGQGLDADAEHLGCSVAEAAEFFAAHFMDYGEALHVDPAAAEVVSGYRARGVRTALVTNTPTALARRILEAAGVELDAVVGGTDVAHAKPAPDILLEACRRLGVGTREALMIGDSRFDRMAAAAASVFFVGLRIDGDRRIEALADLLQSDRL